MFLKAVRLKFTEGISCLSKAHSTLDQLFFVNIF